MMEQEPVIKGTGLGMAIAKQYVKSYGWEN